MVMEVCSLAHSKRSPRQQSGAHVTTYPEPPTPWRKSLSRAAGWWHRVRKTNCTEPGLAMPII